MKVPLDQRPASSPFARLMEHRIIQPFALSALILAAFPLTLFVTFSGYVLQARLYLGHWPSYGNPDPKQLGWWFQHSMLQLGFFGFPVIALTAAGLAVLGRIRSREFPFLMIAATLLVVNVAFVMMAKIDPGGFLDWFWD